jgi:putative glutamine amidotransferase
MRLVSAYYNDSGPFLHSGLFTGLISSSDPNELEPGDCVVVWGGADISPSLYNKAVSKYTHADVKPSHRDKVEWAMMQRAKELGLPIIGICRGAQMLCALAGGTLIQHVNNHGGHHSVVTDTGDTFPVNSIHHQMMNPTGVDHLVWAQTQHRQSEYFYDVDEKIDMPNEPEFLYFPTVRGFAIQWHPEMMAVNSDATSFIFTKLEENL